MTNLITPEAALSLALSDAGVPLTEEGVRGVIEALGRNNWRLVGPDYNPTSDYMDYIQEVHDAGKRAAR